MNVPNQLTVARLFLVPVFIVCMSLDFPAASLLALLVFLLATATDYFDGWLARRLHLESDFGRLMDPLADKILTASAFIYLSANGSVPAWAVVLIIAREFLITGLRTLASSKGIVLPAEKIGKHKTAWQMITIIFFLLLGALPSTLLAAPILGVLDLPLLGALLIGWTTLLTVYSGVAYLWRNRALLANC